MSNVQPDFPGPLAAAFRHELEALRKEWWVFLLLGIALVVCGTIAIGTSFIASIVTVVMFGLLLVTAGVAQLIGTFWAGKWSGFLASMLVGLLYIVIGAMIIDAPVNATVELTLLLAAMLIFVGIFRIVAALTIRFHQWGWLLLNGVISLLLGIMIYRQWPSSGLWVIGTFVGIELIFNGWTWIMLGIGLRAAAPKV